jgi:alpha-ketoglutarate-dependent taurine dioxygenase
LTVRQLFADLSTSSVSMIWFVFVARATLGAVITDVDLANLTDESWAQIHTAFLEYGVLVFPGQHLDEESQGAFARRFGRIEQLSPKQTGPTIEFTYRKADGSLVNSDEQAFKLMKGKEGWHTDSTYMPLASKAAMLAALVVKRATEERP